MNARKFDTDNPTSYVNPEKEKHRKRIQKTRKKQATSRKTAPAGKKKRPYEENEDDFVDYEEGDLYDIM